MVRNVFSKERTGINQARPAATNNLKEIFEKVKPEYVINCANLAGGVDYCESHPDLARKFHLEANISIGKLCQRYNARMVLISTDYVFDGRNAPYKEDDKPNPLNIYGRVKLEAEKWLVNKVARYTVVRTTNVFGWDPETQTPNYMMNLYRTIKARKQFRAPSYLWGNPTHVDDLAAAILELCSLEMNGIFHVVGSSFINRYQWAIEACQVAGWDASLVVAAESIPDDMVPRPLKSNLDTGKFRSLCRTVLRDVEGGVRAFLKSMSEE
jgi:dTDP-4-dehydrorhamnose reductase